MCGIVGYIGDKPAQGILLAGLKRLEYRGYDSSGMAILSLTNNLCIKKAPGKISALEKILKEKPLAGNLGIAHTRWATHGAPTRDNAHPHADCKNNIVVVHNGIIENFEILRTRLIKEGHCFRSQTDTEVIVHLIEKFHKSLSLEEAVRKTLKLLEGSFAIGVIARDNPDTLIGARSGSPLIVGLGRGENFLASDAPAILEYTKDILFLDEKEMIILKRNGYKLEDLEGRPVKRTPVRINWDIAQAQKQGYKHFMLKEINEQPGIIDNLLNFRIQKGNEIIFQEQKIPEHKFRGFKNIFIVACGTAYHAGLVGKYVLESLCSLPTYIDVSSEFRYRDLLINKDTLVLAISQSGETADTLAGVREAKKHGASVLAICNVLGSTLTRESDGVIHTSFSWRLRPSFC